mmetsp:Transcript_95793/g.285958  ORF Transcript_95793/g.285958 Transcript_95793/m.285958 type:complete len:260 (-) Transcript_95793:4-783(-)
MEEEHVGEGALLLGLLQLPQHDLGDLHVRVLVVDLVDHVVPKVLLVFLVQILMLLHLLPPLLTLLLAELLLLHLVHVFDVAQRGPRLCVADPVRLHKILVFIAGEDPHGPTDLLGVHCKRQNRLDVAAAAHRHEPEGVTARLRLEPSAPVCDGLLPLFGLLRCLGAGLARPHHQRLALEAEADPAIVRTGACQPSEVQAFALERKLRDERAVGQPTAGRFGRLQLLACAHGDAAAVLAAGDLPDAAAHAAQPRRTQGGQ